MIRLCNSTTFVFYKNINAGPLKGMDKMHMGTELIGSSVDAHDQISSVTFARWFLVAIAFAVLFAGTLVETDTGTFALRWALAKTFAILALLWRKRMS
jgi:hypothetical protein